MKFLILLVLLAVFSTTNAKHNKIPLRLKDVLPEVKDFTGWPVNHTCHRDSDCDNDACGQITAWPTSPFLCCPSGADVYYNDLAYCTGMNPGDVCLIDAMCASYNCSGSDYGKNYGKCT